jgi:hypothetical protein
MIMIRSTISYLLLAAGADEQEYTISNSDHPSQCMYCHSDGDSELYSCDQNRDQTFLIEKIPESDVGGRSNGYQIKSADNGLCLASNEDKDHLGSDPKIFGWSDCSTSDQGGNGDRSWILTLEDDGMKIESAHYSGTCMATDDGERFFRYPCGGAGQKWNFNPPFDPSAQGTPFTNADGYWHSITSGNQDFSYTLTTGMQFSKGTEVSHSDQVGLSYEMKMSGKFLDLDAEETVGASYMHSWSNTVTNSETHTETQSCTTGCQMKNLPSGYSSFKLMQWRLRGTSSSAEDVLTTLTCHYWCLPEGLEMRCPVDCCSDLQCQTCTPGCVVPSKGTSMVV